MDFQSMLSKLKKDASQAPPPPPPAAAPARKKQKITDGNHHDNLNPHGATSTTTTATASTTTHLSSSSSKYPFPKRKVRTIYLACPANAQTGGPEAIHQLCHKINSLSVTDGKGESANGNGKGKGKGNGHGNSNGNGNIFTTTTATITAYLLFIKEVNHNQNGHHPQAEHVPDANILHTYQTKYPNLKMATSFPMKSDYNYEDDDDDDEKMRNKSGSGVDDTNNGSVNYYYNDSLIIWPECWTYLIDSLQPATIMATTTTKTTATAKTIRRYQTAIWWLSVDNNNDKFKEWQRKDILHLYQSEYAKNHVIKNIQKLKSSSSSSSKEGFNRKSSCDDYSNYNILPMTEFIPNNNNNNHRLKDKICYENRTLEILYNPFKGVHYTDSIIRRSGTKFEFTPIGSIHKRISAQDVTKLLHDAKVYIDFGPHPGMDRLPREAALAGCIVITNMQGAAFYDADVPIPMEYKVKEFDVDSIHRLLVSCIDGYDQRVKDFDLYRDWIHGQEYMMDICVTDMMTKVAVER